MYRSIAFGLATLCLLSATALAAVPTSITVQGRLTDASGNPLPPGFKVLTFKIFNASSGGIEIWPVSANEEDQFINSDGAGLWSATVGKDIPLTNQVFADTVCWLEVKVDDGVNPPVTMPRVRLVTGAYAFRVSTVDGASGGSITSKVAIGPGNTNPGIDAFVAGSSNDATGHYSAIGGGQDNVASGAHSNVGGGRLNVASDQFSTVGGGAGDTASNLYATVGGGVSNRASGEYSIIGGGWFNAASGDNSTISGGQSNSASGEYSASGGGSSNEVSSKWATVAGGQNNHATDTASTVGGGRNNEATGSYATVGGGGGAAAGHRNEANGDYATIPGGFSNVAGGRFSFAAGRSAKATHAGAFVWGDSTDSDFSSTGPNQFLLRATGGVGIGTNDPEAPLHILETSAGAVTANGNSILVLERSTGGWISLVSGDNAQRGILFSEPTTAIAGGIVFDANNANDLAFRTGGNTTRMTLDATGNLNVTGNITATGTCCASDARFKRNVETLPNALAVVQQLRGVHYEWNSEDFPERSFVKGDQLGLIAQEVREVVPQVVIEQSDGYLAVDYARLVPLLIEGMKEQQKRIEKLEATIRSMTP